MDADARCAGSLPCVTPITNQADVFLNAVFTSIYAFVFVQAGLLLITLCLIVARRRQVRLHKIDEKRALQFFEGL